MIINAGSDFQTVTKYLNNIVATSSFCLDEASSSRLYEMVTGIIFNTK